MKCPLIKHIILVLIIIVSISQTAFPQGSKKYSEYTGLYSLQKGGELTYLVFEEKQVLYLQSMEDIFEVALESKTDFYLKRNYHNNSRCRFHNLQNGKYQSLVPVGGELEFIRMDIPDDKLKTVYYKILDSITSINLNGVQSIFVKMPGMESPGECEFDIKTGTLEEVKGDKPKIDKLVKHISRGGLGDLNCLLVSKNGKLVVEEYFNGYKSGDSQATGSVVKSIISLLLGEALDKYNISVNDRIIKYLPEYKPLLTGRKKKLTIKDVATMSSGLEWYYNYDLQDPENIWNRMRRSPDPVEFHLSHPLVFKPGKVFNYSTGDTTVLAKLIEKISGKSFPEFLKQSSLNDLCLKNTYWDLNNNVVACLSMRPRDMAKIGQLVHNDGVWNGKQIVSKEWIRESTKRHINTHTSWNTGKSWDGYGYQWWHKTFRVNNREFKAVAAHGYGGRKIIIIKELDLVIVVTTNNRDGAVYRIADLVIEAFI